MDVAAWWFVSLAPICVISFIAGNVLGRGSTARVWAWQGVSLGLLGLWVWLIQNPSVATRAISPDVMRYLEGIGAAPIFALLIGVVWARCALRRQRCVAALALAAGVYYFVYGGMWMLQSTPRDGFTQLERGKLVMQSQDFSCVPAAAATALRQLDVPATEAEMAVLTDTRPGSGSTLIRALAGLRVKLVDTHIQPVLVQPEWDDLRTLPMPALTPLRLERGQQHMVVLLRVTRRGAWVADPATGVSWMPRSKIEPVYTGGMIVFMPRQPQDGLASPAYLAQVR